MITAEEAKSLMPEPKEFQEDCRRIDELIVEAAKAGENSVTYHLTGPHEDRIRLHYLNRGFGVSFLFFKHRDFGKVVCTVVVSWTG